MAGVRFTADAAALVAEAARHTLANRSIDPAAAGASASSPAEAFTARCTSATADANGNYPGVITRYDAPTAAWVDYGACKIRTANGETLASGTRYGVVPAGTTASGDALFGTIAVASGSDAIPIGTIAAYGGASAPAGWMLCNGGAVSRTTYADLYAAVGTTWGAGDGSTTFNVPDLQGRTPVGAGSGAGLTARTLAGKVGEESHTLIGGEVPSHSHSVYYGTTTPGAGLGQAVESTSGVATQYQTGSAFGNGGPLGTCLAHNNMQPSAVVNFVIKFAFQAGYVNPFNGSGVVGISGTFS